MEMKRSAVGHSNVQLMKALDALDLQQKSRRKAKRRRTLLEIYGEKSEGRNIFKVALKLKENVYSYSKHTSNLHSTNVKPYVKFRRAARAVKSLVQVCKVCKDLVFQSIMREEWYDMVDTIMKREEGLKNMRKQRNRPFTAYVANDQQQCLEEITFDASHFSREHRADYLLTESVQTALETKAGKRSKHQIAELVTYLKMVSPDFNLHPSESQKRIAQCMWYDRYEKNRVITKEGTAADAVYFLLSGTLVEKTEGKDLKEITAGAKFGENELICACARRSTVVTKSPIDLITVHRLDYKSIINLSDDTDDPAYLDILRFEMVWRHFPLFKLTENSSVWTVLSYKFGRLIAKDSNNLEWIYVIRKGEARVIKTLTTSEVNLDVQRRRVQNLLNAESEFYQANKFINFESEAEYLKSSYSPSEYRPRTVCSAAAELSRGSRLSAAFSLDTGRTWDDSTPRSYNSSGFHPRDTGLLDREANVLPGESFNYGTVIDRVLKTNTPQRVRPLYSGVQRQSLVRFPKLSSRPQTSISDGRNVKIPSHVQLETLRRGQCFGFRSCLDPREQGPAASLVSAGCEVLQISRKFFKAYADENVMGLLKVKYKPYPTEQELIDRMYSNVQWEQYKQRAVMDHLNGKGKTKEPYSSTFVLVT